jgi:Fic family protein
MIVSYEAIMQIYETTHSSLAIEGNTLNIEHISAILEKTSVIGPIKELKQR